MTTGDNVESSSSTFLDGPRVGDLGGGYIYQCLKPFRGFAPSMEGGGLRGDQYLAGMSHRSG